MTASDVAEEARLKAKAKRKQKRSDAGHWRNRWRIPDEHGPLVRSRGARPLGDGTWIGWARFPTAEAAENYGRKVAPDFAPFGLRYLGPEFFPQY